MQVYLEVYRYLLDSVICQHAVKSAEVRSLNIIYIYIYIYILKYFLFVLKIREGGQMVSGQYFKHMDIEKIF